MRNGFYNLSAFVLLTSFILVCFPGISSSRLAERVTSIIEDASGIGPAVGIINNINSKLTGEKYPGDNPPVKTDQKSKNTKGTLFLLLLQSLQGCSDCRFIIALMAIMMNCCMGAVFIREYKKITAVVLIEDLSYHLRCLGIRTPRDRFLEVYRYNIGIGVGVKSGGVYMTHKKPAFWFIENGMRAFFNCKEEYYEREKKYCL